MEHEQERIKQLKLAYDELLPKAKSWNRDRILLAWGFGSAIVITLIIDLYQYFFDEYDANIEKLIASFLTDYYLWGLLIILIFGLVIALTAGKIIDIHANDINKTLRVLETEIKNLEKSQ